MDGKMEKVLTMFKKNTEAAGKFFAVKTVGQIVLDLIASGVDPTVENICQSLRDKISLTKSARGSIEQDLDQERAPLEIALYCVENKIRSPE